MKIATQIVPPDPYSCHRVKSGCRRRLFAASLTLVFAALLPLARAQSGRPLLAWRWFNGSNRPGGCPCRRGLRFSFSCALAVAFLGAIVAANGQTLLTFDDLPSGGPLTTMFPGVPNNYGGLDLNWDNFGVANGLEFGATPGDGYYYGVVSPSNAVFNLEGYPASISSASGLFDLNSAYLTSAGPNYPTLNIQVEGFVGATMVYSNTYTVTNSGPTLITFNYVGVDSVTFIAGVGWASWFVMDNVTITKPSASPGAPPVITVQPQSQTNYAGATATFLVSATSLSPLSYQWQKNGTNLVNDGNISGATTNTLIITGISDSEAAAYSVIVSNSNSSVTSSNATLTVNDSPFIATQPLSQTADAGSNVTFTVTTYGAPPFTFQWYLNASPVGSPISGTNVSSYTLTDVQTNQSGSYSVLVTNGYGSVMSSNAVLIVEASPPVVTGQPQSLAAFLGSTAQLKAVVSGTTPLAYQWQLNGTNVNLLSDGTNFTGANSNVLTILNVTTNDVGSYRLTVTNNYGSAVSSNAVLTIAQPVQPALVGEWIAGGTNFADVSGYSPAGTHDGFAVGGQNYMWSSDVPTYRLGQSLNFPNGDSGIAIANSSTLDAGYTNTFDGGISNTFSVACWAKGSFISRYVGRSPYLSKYGDNGLGWQLRYAGGYPCWTVQETYYACPVWGCPSPDLISPYATANDGKWHFYVGTFNAVTGRNLYTDGVLVGQTGNELPYNTPPVSHVCIGCQDQGNNVFADWLPNNVHLYDMRIYNYELTPTQVMSLYTTLPPGTPAQIGVQPPAHVIAAVTVEINAQSGGSLPLTNQWTFNGTNLANGTLPDGAIISGANTASLTIANVTTNENGAYALVAANAFGSMVSSNALLTIQIPALVGEWIAGGTNFADVSGYSPAGTHDGFDIGNAGGSYYFTNDVPPGKTGYSLYLTNDGIAISNSATSDANYTNTFDDQINNAFTISFWSKGWPTPWGPWVSKWGDFVTYPDYSTTSGWQFRQYGSSGYACFTVRDNNAGGLVFGNTSFDLDDLASTSHSNDGNWHFYAGTFDASTGVRDLYVDSVLVAQETNNVAYTLAAAEHLVIGGKDSPPGNSFGSYSTFEIYDLRIYNYALTNGVPPPPPSPPNISVQPQSVSVFTNTMAQFRANASGPAPLVYQWQLNGTNVNLLSDGTNFAGANSNVLTILNATTNDVGSYRLIVTNNYGSAVSSNALLTIQIPALVGEWIAGGTNFADVSGYSPAGTHDGVAVGAQSYTWSSDVPPNRSGYSLSFPASSASGIAISNSATSDPGYTNTYDGAVSTYLTVSMWVKGTFGAYSAGWPAFAVKNGESAGWQLRGAQWAAPCWTVRDGNAGTMFNGQNGGWDGPDDMSANASFDGNWHFYTGTYNSITGYRALYIDGQLSVYETGNVPYFAAGSAHVTINCEDSGNGSYGAYCQPAFKYYDLRIYNYAVPNSSCPRPALVISPTTTNVFYGQTVQLNAGGGGGPFGWTSNGVPILGATTNSLTVTNVTVSATYTCYAIDSCGPYSVAVFIVNVVPSFNGTPIVLNGNQVVLAWSSGTLLEATNLAGPWTPVAGATSPYTNNVTAAPQMFFKLQ